MSGYKLTPLEELRLEKKRIREDRDIAGQRLSYQLQYFNDNWSSLITKGIASSLRNRFQETVESLTAPSNASPFFTKRTNPVLGLITSNLPAVGRIVWNMAKPAIMAFVAKRFTSMLFGRKRRK